MNNKIYINEDNQLQKNCSNGNDYSVDESVDTNITDNLSCASSKDMQMVEVAMKKRWPIPDKLKIELINKLTKSLAIITDPRTITRITQILAQLEAQNQSDEHLEIKNNRLDQGKPTENQHIKVKLNFDDRV